MKDARCTAAQALLRLDAANAYSNLVIDALISRNGLDARDGAFASALFYAALERMLTIDHILRAHCTIPLEQIEKPVLAALRLGICQLLYLDGVDDYAAVSESVNLVKALGRPRASGFVNGVLRSFLRAGKQIPPAAGDRAEQLSVKYACPSWLVRIWLESYGEQAALRVLEGSLGRPPVYLRANTCRCSAEQLAAMLREQGVQAQADPELEGCVALQGKAPIEQLPGFAQGLFHVQDRASQLCAAALGAQPGERVLDVCSAPGGKTFTIAERMQNRGEVVARDLHEKRAGLVRRGARRLGLEIVDAKAGDACVFDPALGGFDRVLCDVPCSGFGIIRRKPEIKYKTLESIQNLPEIQYKILQTSSQYLHGGGRLVYSTCTLLPAENEAVVKRFLEGNAGFSLEDQHTYTGEQTDTDGFFVAVLTRR